VRFHLLNVFAQEKFLGAPLALVEDADELSGHDAIAFAREFATCETAFLSSPRDPVNSARLTILSREGGEAPSAAHALIGATTTLAQTRAADMLARRGIVIALEFMDDVVACDVIRNSRGACYAQFAFKETPRLCSDTPSATELAEIVRLEAHDVGFADHAPRCYHARTSIFFTPIGSRDALTRSAPDVSRLSRLPRDISGVYLYTAETVSPEAAIHARFFRRDGREILAHGDALAGFAGVACEFEHPADGAHEIVVEEEYPLGRPARLTLGVEVAHGSPMRVTLGGQTRPIARGDLLA